MKLQLGGIGRDGKSCGVDFKVGTGISSKCVNSLYYNIGSEQGDTECEKDYQDDDFDKDDEDCILSYEKGFEFLNANEDEWIDSLQ
ncbi:hypothetical protein NC651_032866 [Populus alba x Populus x berolinensis]|nr:hypothetical protein NC651_032866 [Populus alba x Populus x berolinensis]